MNRIFISLLASLSFLADAADLTSQYTFMPVKIGGGGWVLGVAVHPTTADVTYCWTDVGGAYRWDARSNRWHQLITAARMPADLMAANDNKQGAGAYRQGAYNVECLALDPSDHKIVYISAGKGDDADSSPGFILKSIDGGESFTWLKECQIKIAGNGEGRGMDRIQVDPINGKVVYIGSRVDGLMRSLDAGKMWSRVKDVPLGQIIEKKNFGVTGIAFDGDSLPFQQRCSRVYAAVANQGIWTSENGGDDWALITGNGGPSNKGVAVRLSVVEGTLFVAYEHHEGAGQGIWSYTPANGWRDISPQVDKPWDIAIDSKNPLRLYAINTWGAATIFRSVDGGGRWQQLISGSADLAGQKHFISTLAPWKTTAPSDTPKWRSVGQLKFDPHVSGRLWFAEGFGMWRCDNATDVNNAPDFIDISNGIEELVCNQVLDLPGKRTLIATWDRPGFISEKSEESPLGSPFSGVFSDMNAAATSGGSPHIVVATVSDHSYLRHNVSARSADGGMTWIPFASTPANADPTPADLKFGEIVISATDPDLLIWYPRNTDPKLYMSRDRGDTWSPAKIEGLTGFQGYFIASRRVLVADRVEQLFGIYSWKEASMFISSDGATWTERQTTGLPSYCWWAIQQATPGKARDWWFATGFDYRAPDGQRGLLNSIDGGVTWTFNSGWDDAWAFGFGKSAPGSNYPTIFAYGRRGGQWGLYRSIDRAQSWDLCSAYPGGLFDRVSSVTGDMDTFGRVHLGYGGNTAIEGFWDQK